MSELSNARKDALHSAPQHVIMQALRHADERLLLLNLGSRLSTDRRQCSCWR